MFCVSAAVAAGGTDRFGQSGLGAPFGTEHGAVIIDLVALEIGNDVGKTRPGEHLSDKGFAVSPAVGVVLKEGDRPGDARAGDRPGLAFVERIEHAHQAAVVRVAVAGVPAADRDGTVGDESVAAGEDPSHELFDPQRTVAFVVEHKRNVRRAFRDRSAAEAYDAARTADAAFSLMSLTGNASARQGQARIQHTAAGNQGIAEKAGYTADIAVARGVDVNVDAPQRQVADVCAVELGKQAREYGGVSFRVAVHGVGGILPGPGDVKIVNSMATAIKVPEEGKRRPVRPSHIQVAVQVITPVGVRGDGCEFLRRADGRCTVLRPGGDCRDEQNNQYKYGRNHSFRHDQTLP